ncbi:hypothetical protein Hanom_Chr16g01489801 [Helianthus anomalus]
MLTSFPLSPKFSTCSPNSENQRSNKGVSNSVHITKPTAAQTVRLSNLEPPSFELVRSWLNIIYEFYIYIFLFNSISKISFSDSFTPQILFISAYLVHFYVEGVHFIIKNMLRTSRTA